MARGHYKVTLARRADWMLIAHTGFLADVSPAAARGLLTDFKAASKRIADDPFQFPYADEMDVPDMPAETYRKCLFYGRYKALFLVEGDEVYIDAIIDCRQENKSLY
ncbi:MAG: hypothetical protein LBH86_00580 [Oscillospiraceae bacterium]|jgi:hypothetical protein|nr:hypothetical protein [Oscillospiraceae bacterium]